MELSDDGKLMNEKFRGQNSYYIVVNDANDTVKTPDKSSRPEVFCKKDVLRNFAKFTGKQLCQSLFLNKVSGLSRRRSGVFIVNFEHISLLVLTFLLLTLNR